ncbi:MAG: mechanosensitive ion channel [bacterium]|nr:mechanosensitive ion channel [bacterium]
MAAFWRNILLPTLDGILSNLTALVPSLLASLAILLVGWLVAKAVSGLVSRLLNRLGFNTLAERAGITGLIRGAGFSYEPSEIVGKLIFWLLILTFFLSAAEQLKLTAIVVTLQKLVAFIPNLIAVVLIGVFGARFGRFIGGLVSGSAREAGIEFSDFLGKLVNSLVLIIVIVMAVTQLEIKSSMLEITFATVLSAFCLGIALMFGMGSRSIAQNILAGLYARRAFQPGQHVAIQNVQGELLEIGAVSAMVRTAENRTVTLPNRMLIDEIAESDSGQSATR